jgi:L-threonylcarbamoyladenylate synthase
MPSLDTIVVKIDPVSPESEAINTAAEVLKRGGLVAFPTETVYGLAADALNPEAIKMVFLAKGRPSDNPMIVHVAELKHLEVLTEDIPPRAKALIDVFWPGPLTLIFKKSSEVPAVVTGGQETVAVRMPGNNVALALIRAFGGSIAAPSANLSGRPSGTTGMHILQDLGGKINMILDAGPVEVGVESTVLDLSTHPATILRPGAVTIEQLKGVIGEVVLGKSGKLLRRSPGTRYRHYSPKAEVILVKPKDRQKIIQLVEQYTATGKKVGLISRYPHPGLNNGKVIIKAMPQDLREYARLIFATLRELDGEGIDHIIVEEVEERGIGVAIMDRLRRASSGK